MERLVVDAVRGQIEGWDRDARKRTLRMPLGLILLSRGWITRDELQGALAAQRAAGSGRIGEWLRRLYAISPSTIAKALATQWNCTVLPSTSAGLEPVTGCLPSFFDQHYGLVVMQQGSDISLYLAGRCRAEFAAARSLESMLGRPVKPAFLEDHAWENARRGTAEEGTIDACRGDGIAARICELVETTRPVDARMVRIHNHVWLRMWLADRCRRQVRDVVLSLQDERRQNGLEDAKNARTEIDAEWSLSCK